MVDHRNPGSENHGVPRGQDAQWHPLSFPAVRLPAAICGRWVAGGGSAICTDAPAIQAPDWAPIQGESDLTWWSNPERTAHPYAYHSLNLAQQYNLYLGIFKGYVKPSKMK